jgi:hypothetical protein
MNNKVCNLVGELILVIILSLKILKIIPIISRKSFEIITIVIVFY